MIVIAELAAVDDRAAHRPYTCGLDQPVARGLGRWDAVHYLDLSHRGYYGTDMAFFPLYPALIALVAKFTGNHLVAGLIVSNTACFVGLLFFYKLVEHQFDRSVAHRAIFYISIFPTAIFFSAVYTESLFFALTVASFYFIRERKWVMAGLIGFFASLTRVEGVLLLAPFLIEAWPAHHKPKTSALRVGIGALLIPLGLAVYMWYLWVLSGDPMYFSHVQAHWNRHFAPPWVSIWHSFHVIATAKRPQTVAAQVIELSFTALMLAMLGIALAFKELRDRLVVLDLHGALDHHPDVHVELDEHAALCARALSDVYDLCAVGRNPVVNNAIVAFSLPLLGLFTVLFADWYWVA